jgi:serine/threonine protein kinase
MESTFKGNERYQLERKLGGGASGLVYLAYDRQRNQHVALKALRQLDATSLFRFKQEFRSLANVVHRNLAALYELICENDRWFLTMEYVEGVDFLTYVRGPQTDPTTASPRGDGQVSSPPPAPEDDETVEARTPAFAARAEASRIAAPFETHGMRRVAQPGAVILTRLRQALSQLTRAIMTLHDTGHVHRDIKPSNVLVSAEGRVVVLDFGVIAELKAIGVKAELNEFTGTPPYMAPEQLAEKPAVNPASDWYAVGVILYEALTGVRPFHGSLPEIIQAKEMSALPAPHTFWPAVPAELDELCVALLERDPARRPTGPQILALLAPSQDEPQQPPLVLRDSEAPLIGREKHLDQLARAFRATRSGQGVAVMVPGRSGIGKSALIERFIASVSAHEGELVVLAGRCYEGETVAYKALDSLVDATCRFLLGTDREVTQELIPDDIVALVTAFPVLRRVGVIEEKVRDRGGRAEDALELRRRAFAALRELFGRIAMRWPLVIYIDDLQWGDVESAPMLANLFGAKAPPLLFIASYRSEESEQGALLREIQGVIEDARLSRGDAERLQQMSVDSLNEEEASALSRELLGDHARDDLVDHIVKEAGGSPYLINELARFTVEGQSASGRAMSLETVILARAQRLSVSARRLLEVIAVAGGPVSQQVVRTTAQLREQIEGGGIEVDHQRAFVELRAGKFITLSGLREHDRVETYHDRVREAVLTDLGQERARIWHQHLAAVLDTTEAPRWPEQIYTLARHYFRGYPSDSAGRAFEVNYLAAQTAVESFAYAQAYRFIEQARIVAKGSDISCDAAFEQLAGEVGARNRTPR